MQLDIKVIPCLSDNYAFLLRCPETNEVGLVDAPESGPILAALNENGWGLDKILLTHHHADHIDGVAKLVAVTGAKVYGNQADAQRLPKLDVGVMDGDTVSVGNSTADVIDVAGHTIGHIAFLFKTAKAAFTADSLMAFGCGRVFEGTMAQMWGSLQKFLDLDPDTLIYSGHEYTQSNARFALTIEPLNADLQARVKDVDQSREKGLATVPSRLSLELSTNPFMRAHQPSVKQALGMGDASDADVFAAIRTAKDNF